MPLVGTSSLMPSLSFISFARFLASSTRRSVAPYALEYADAARLKESAAFAYSSLKGAKQVEWRV
jgi:hypothetical protein